MTRAEQVEHDALNKATHRCPRCGGRSEVSVDTRGRLVQPDERPGTWVACPVCVKFGPFGLVPEALAIEAVLMAEVSPIEVEMRAKNALRSVTVDWLLNDKVAHCPKCKGTGRWQNPHKKKDRRVCFTCDGRGVLR